MRARLLIDHMVPIYLHGKLINIKKLSLYRWVNCEMACGTRHFIVSHVVCGIVSHSVRSHIPPI